MISTLRTTISCSVLALAAFLGPASLAPESKPAIDLQQGVMAGEVTQTAAILQSRLTSSRAFRDSRWLGIVGTRGIGRFELSQQSDFGNSFYTEWITARPEYDFIVKTKVTELLPSTRYYYRLIYGWDKNSLQTSQTCRFRTHSGSQAVDEFSFAIVTGMNYSFFHHQRTRNQSIPPYRGPDKHLGYPALAVILRLKPDFFVGTGDNVYYDHPGNEDLQVGRAETQHQMRMKHHEQYSQPRFIQLFREVATYWMKDDHDYRFNDSDPINPILIRNNVGLDYYPKTNLYPRYSGSGFKPSHELGVRIFREQLPVVDPEDENAVTYRTYRVNKLLQIWFVEGRDYRTPNDMPDGPEKTIWGKEQKKWLKKTLLESDATFKILYSPTPMVGPDDASKRDNHVNPRGIRHEGNEFFCWLKANGFSSDRFFIVCGDRHWQYRAIHPSGFEEFSCGALVDANAGLGSYPGQPRSSDPEGKIKQPYHYKEPTGGFLMVTVKPAADMTTATAAFTFYDEKGVVLYSHSKKVKTK